MDGTSSAGPVPGPGSVLVVDDDPAIRRSLERGLRLSGFRPNERGRPFGRGAFLRGESPRGDVRLVGLDAGRVPRRDGLLAFDVLEHQFISV